MSLPDWEELWVALRQEEIRSLTKAGSSGKGVRIKKEEEEDVALAFAGKQEKRKKSKRHLFLPPFIIQQTSLFLSNFKFLQVINM